MTLKLITPDRYRYVTSESQYYDPANPTANWKQRYYINRNDAYNLNDEAFADDIVFADASTNKKQNGQYVNPIHVLAGANGTKTDLCYAYIPFIMENTYAQNIYNVGFQFYPNPCYVEALDGRMFSYKSANTNPGEITNTLENQDANSGGSKLSGFNLDNIRLFVLGAINSTYYPTYNATLRNLQSSFWTDGRPGCLSKELHGMSVRVYLAPSKAEEAINWWKYDSEDATYQGDDIGFKASYKIKHWLDGSRTNPHLTYSGISAVEGTPISIPALGAIWGYFFFSVSDQFDYANQFQLGGANTRFTTHGKWGQGDLENCNMSQASGGEGKTGILNWIAAPWNGTPTPCRVVRYGLHVVGRKAG